MSPIGVLRTGPNKLSKFALDWNANDLSLTARTGQVGVLTRATKGWARDASGYLYQQQNNMPRWEWDPVAAVMGLLVEPASTNLATYSELFSNAAWVKNGTTAVTAGQSDPYGTSVAFLVTTTSNGDSMYIAVTFTGDGTKAASIYLRAGTAAVSEVAIFDNTAAATRVRVRATWSGGVPTLSIVAGSGTLFPVEPWAGGWYRIKFSGDNVVAANANRIYLYPGGASGQGTVYGFGADPEDLLGCSGYMPTSGATATRNTEWLQFPLVLTPAQLAAYGGFSWYEQYIIRRPWDASTTTDVTNIGNLSVASVNALLMGVLSGTGFSSRWNTPGGNLSTTPNPASYLVGQSVERLCTVSAAGAATGSVAINGGAPVVGSPTAAIGYPAAWNNNFITIGDGTTAARMGFRLQLRARLAMGVQSFTYMQQG